MSGQAAAPPGEPYNSCVEPVIGGLVEVEVSGWGYWNVWISVESYYSGDANTALQPGEAVGVAVRLVVGAVMPPRRSLRSWPLSGIRSTPGMTCPPSNGPS